MDTSLHHTHFYQQFKTISAKNYNHTTTKAKQDNLKEKDTNQNKKDK